MKLATKQVLGKERMQVKKKSRPEYCENCKKQFFDSEITVTFNENEMSKTFCTSCGNLYKDNYRQKMLREKRSVR